MIKSRESEDIRLSLKTVSCRSENKEKVRLKS